MAPSSSVQLFIEIALFRATTPNYVLSYPEPKQRWIIKKHLLALINDYPSFKLSADTFTHNDGTNANLLNASGSLRVTGFKYAPPVPLIIWLHENYPYMPPIVLVSPNESITPIHQNHPFVDSFSGFTSTPYIQTWVFPRCNLSELVHNLVKIFSHDHPFITTYSPCSSLTHPSSVSKMEALDRLSGMIHYDMIELKAKNEEEAERLSILQVELNKRKDDIEEIMTSLDQERLSLKKRLMELTEQADVFMNWLRANEIPIEEDAILVDNAFEGVDDESRLMIENLAGDLAIEDLMYELDRAVEEGIVPFDWYIKQVRLLAREQFLHRYVLVELRTS